MANKHYVNNVELFKVMVDYKKTVKIAKKDNLPKPILPDYVGECILKIAEHLSHKPNFFNYPFKEDMIGDGVENCLLYVDNFNEKVSKNPFAYFTQIIYYAFLRRIQREKKQLAIKYACIQNSTEFLDYVNQASDDKAYDNTYIKFLRKNMWEITAEFEEKKKKAKVKKKVGLERFTEDEVVVVPAKKMMGRRKKTQ